MRTRKDEGQATVELALALPVVVAMALLIVQVVLIGRDQLLVAHAARVAVREAAVDHNQASVRRAAVRSAPALKPAKVSTETSYQGGSPGMVIVRVRYAAPTDVPLVGPLLPDLTLTANAAMRDETDKAGRSVVSEVEKGAGLASSRNESHV